MNVIDFLKQATELGVSDLFIVAGRPLSCKKDGRIMTFGEDRVMPAQTDSLIREIYQLASGRDISHFLRKGDDDFSFAVPGLAGSASAPTCSAVPWPPVIRVISFELPDASALNIPEQVIGLGNLSHGLVLVSGPAGNGKSMTLACIIDAINRTYEKHIITLEDPLEFLHSHKKSIVSQREISTDTKSYVAALSRRPPPESRCDPAGRDA